MTGNGEARSQGNIMALIRHGGMIPPLVLTCVQTGVSKSYYCIKKNRRLEVDERHREAYFHSTAKEHVSGGTVLRRLNGKVLTAIYKDSC